eukprot:TRINITY_DN47508_c0_g1_i1.p1 TRINITY_DN47508_c0_g1~~TRINITY_DN47508_c0_g1_i1.p1  ORF type:complete len:675 (+),score=117.64 TRINITY_DN47508_c0_g1_i1:46-2025(+)
MRTLFKVSVSALLWAATSLRGARPRELTTMREYESGKWGFSLVWGWYASVFPRAFAIAMPNALLAFLLGTFSNGPVASLEDESAKTGVSLFGAFSSVLFFVLYFRSNVAYSRWWEGGTLLQQVRGEWFNAYSSLIAFSNADPKKDAEVEAFHHMLARLMSMLFCCALQQVSPNQNAVFEMLNAEGIEEEHLEFLNKVDDKVEIILQWIQRGTILNMSTGIISAAPPILSRAFQELSRGIVNLQNARKIADFPFPFPYAQTSIVMLLIQWVMTPLVTTVLLSRTVAFFTSFCIVFFPWCIHFIALELEMPFGEKDNDLPLHQMQHDWNKSLAMLLATRAQRPPRFDFEPAKHRDMVIGPSSSGGRSSSKRLSVPAGSLREAHSPEKDASKSGRPGSKELARKNDEVLLHEKPLSEKASSSTVARSKDAEVRGAEVLAAVPGPKEHRRGRPPSMDVVSMRLSEMEVDGASPFMEACKGSNPGKPLASDVSTRLTDNTGDNMSEDTASLCWTVGRQLESPRMSTTSGQGGLDLSSAPAASAFAGGYQNYGNNQHNLAANQAAIEESLQSFKQRMDAARMRAMQCQAASSAKEPSSPETPCSGTVLLPRESFEVDSDAASGLRSRSLSPQGRDSTDSEPEVPPKGRVRMNCGRSVSPDRTEAV